MAVLAVVAAGVAVLAPGGGAPAAAGSRVVSVDADWGLLPTELKQASWGAPVGVARQVSIRGHMDGSNLVPWVRSLHGPWQGLQFTYWVAGNEAILNNGAFVNANMDTPPSVYPAQSGRLGGDHEFDWGPFHVTGGAPYLVGREFRVAFMTDAKVPATRTDIGYYLDVVRQEARQAGLPRPDEWGVWMCSSHEIPVPGGPRNADDPGTVTVQRSPADNIGGWAEPRFSHTGKYKFDADPAYEVPLYWLNGTEITNTHSNGADIRDLTIGAKLGQTRTDSRNGDGELFNRTGFGISFWTGCDAGDNMKKIAASDTTSNLGESLVTYAGTIGTSLDEFSSSVPTQLLAVSPPLSVADLPTQVAISNTRSGPSNGLAGKADLTVAGGTHTTYRLRLASAPSGPVTVTATASGPVRLLSGDRPDTPANRAAAATTATVSWDQNDWGQTRTVSVFAFGENAVNDRPFKIAHRFSEGFFDKHILMTTPTGQGDDKSALKRLGFLDARYAVTGTVPALEVTAVPSIVHTQGGTPPAIAAIGANDPRTFTVKLSGPPTGWSATVYVSPVDDLARVQPRCKVAHPDWACRSVGQLLTNSSGDPVYVWSFTEPPLTLWHGDNDACLTAPSSGTCSAHVRDNKFSKPASSPYIELKFTRSNWDTPQTVTVLRTGNRPPGSFRPDVPLYLSFVHPWQLHTDFKTDAKTKKIDVYVAGRIPALNSPQQQVEFHGVEENSDGVPKQMSDAEVQQLQQQQQPAFAADAAVVADVRSYAAETHRGTEHVDRWKQVLVGLCADEFPGVQAMTASEAQTYADYGWTRWDPVAVELAAAEAAGGCNTPPPPPPPPPTPEIGISAGADVAEGGDAVFTVTASPAPAASLDVTVDVSQTGDYTSGVGSRTVTIPANSATATVTVATVDDSSDEADGSVAATVQAGSGYTVAAASSASVAVADDDPPVQQQQQVFVADAALVADVRSYAAETHRGTVHVDRWRSVLMGLCADDFAGLTAMTAAEAQTYADYGWTRWDPVVTGLAAAEAAGGCNTPTPPPLTPPPPPVTPEISVSGGAGVTEGQGAVFTLTASPPPASPLSVSVDVSQTGDYTAGSGTRTVTIGTSGTATVTVATTDDSADEADGSVTATVAAGTGYTVGSASAATVAVSDNDDPPPPPPPPTVDEEGVTVIAVNPTVTEGEWAVFHITSNPTPAAYTLAVRYRHTADGRMIMGPRSISGSGVFMRDDGIIEYRVKTIDDRSDTADGTVTLTITGVIGNRAPLSSVTAATVTVLDND